MVLRDVRCYVRWQQSRQVKATLSSLKTTCELPTCSLAPFCFSCDRSPCCFSVTSPPATTITTTLLLAPSFVLKCQIAIRWLTNADTDYSVRGPDKQLRQSGKSDVRQKEKTRPVSLSVLLSIDRLPDLTLLILS